VIFLSGADADDDRILGLSIGGVDYVSKPFSPGELTARIQVHLNLARRQQQAPPIAAEDEQHMEAESDPDAVLVNAVKRLISDNLAALPGWPKSRAASAPTAKNCRRYSASRPA
jgi:DNA-binding response OmpR family regulator